MDEQFRPGLEERAREMIRRGDFGHLVNPGRGARLDRDIQDDWSLRYSIRDIPTFDGKGDSMPLIHIIEFGDILVNTGSEINDLPKEPQVDDRDDREYHRAVIKHVVSKFKTSLKGKPRLWFEMQYPTPDDEPKTKEEYENMVSSFCHICYFESKDVPTQMTKQSFTIIYFITFKKTIHFKIICRNVHS